MVATTAAIPAQPPIAAAVPAPTAAVVAPIAAPLPSEPERPSWSSLPATISWVRVA